jgi:hypothetical protein
VGESFQRRKDQNDGLWNDWWLVRLRFEVDFICCSLTECLYRKNLQGK